MKYKVGDKVQIKSLDWYNENINEIDEVHCGNTVFIPDMVQYISDIVTISEVFPILGIYRIKEDSGMYNWTDEMIEGLVEEENNDCEKCGLTRNPLRCLFMDYCPHNKQKNIIEIHEDWVLKDENGNIINAMKIVLEKKKMEYPKTYEECGEVLDIIDNWSIWHGYRSVQLKIFQKLLICRDAYWKIYGDEMGLGKPWEPDRAPVYTITRNDGYIIKDTSGGNDEVLEFPTEEMRDSFYENFKSEIGICKELL